MKYVNTQKKRYHFTWEMAHMHNSKLNNFHLSFQTLQKSFYTEKWPVLSFSQRKGEVETRKQEHLD